MTDLLAAFHHTQANWAEIERSRVCGCCNCQEVFAATEIVAWTGLDLDHLDDPDAVNRQTAFCPRCGSEAVIGDAAGFALTPDFLHQMNDAWFQQTIIRRPSRRP